MKLYIATPINGRNEESFEEKYRAAKERITFIKPQLLANPHFKGWEAVAGTDICPLGMSEHDALKRCVQEVYTCDAIYMDNGWERSDGCRHELETAHRYRIPVYTYDGNVMTWEN